MTNYSARFAAMRPYRLGSGKMGERLDLALKIRDSAREKLRANGSFEETSIGPMLCWRMGGLHVSYRTPFQKLPAVPEHLNYMAAILCKSVENLSYGLDIWDDEYGGKVLNIEWKEEGDVELVSFRRGNWESKVLAFTSVKNS